MSRRGYRRLREPAFEAAIEALRAGGLIAYPTEGVFGLGCRPDRVAAIRRLLALKQRPVSAGLILIAAEGALFSGWVATGTRIPDPGGIPLTWIVPPGPKAHRWITGSHPGIAVRITTHPIAAALSIRLGMPLISTSANRKGRPPARTPDTVRRWLGPHLDAIAPGRIGSASGPSEIRVLGDGRVLRPAAGPPARAAE